MVANSQTPIHQRLWCVLEAHILLSRKKISRVRIAGHVHYLLTSSDSKIIKDEIDSFLVDAAPLIETAEIMTKALSSGEIDEQDYWSQAQHIQHRIDEIYQRLYTVRSKILCRPDSEIINIDSATTSYPEDETMIRKFITDTGSKEQVCSMVANLVRKHIRSSLKEAVTVTEETYTSIQKDVVMKYAGLQDVVATGEVVDDRHESREGLAKWMQTLSHVIPVALVQFTDYMSDIFVVVELYKQRNSGLDDGLKTLALIAICISIALAWGLLILTPGYDTKDKLIMFFLAPLNLHILYLGVIMVGQERYLGGEKENFTNFKAFESMVESSIMSLITFAILAEGSFGEVKTLYISSLGLSVVSMAYAFSSKYLVSGTFDAPLQSFFCTLVHVCWEVMVLGSAIGLAPDMWLVPEKKAFLIFGAHLWVNGAFVGRIAWLQSQGESTFNRVMITNSSACYFMMDYTFTVPLNGAVDSNQCSKYYYLCPILRRVTLLSIAVYIIILYLSPTMITILISLFTADVLCFLHMLKLSDIDWDWSALEITSQFLFSPISKGEDIGSNIALHYTSPENDADDLTDDCMTSSSTMVLYTMFDAIVLEYGNGHDALLDICKQIKADASQFPSKLTLAAHAKALQVLHAYRPKTNKHILKKRAIT